jgi:RNA polymerase sigma-70 factor (ECF subfamily)
MEADSKASEFLLTFLDYRNRLEAFVFGIVGCRGAAADLVQDLFLRFWGRSIDRPGDAVAYLFRSAQNLAIDHLRAQRVRVSRGAGILPEPRVDESQSPDAVLTARDELRLVDEALRVLPERTAVIERVTIQDADYGT